MKPSTIFHAAANMFGAFLLLSLGLFATPAMAAPGFAYAITDVGQNKADPVLKQNFAIVKIGSLTKRKPAYANWSTDIVALKTPQGVEVVSFASSPADGSNAYCPANDRTNCRQEHVLTLNAVGCSLKGQYVATFEQWVWDVSKNAHVPQQESVPFTLQGGGECVAGETRMTLAQLKEAADAASRPPVQPTQYVQLKAYGRADSCIVEGVDTSAFGYCNSYGAQWRHQDNRLWTTTGKGDLCLVVEYDDATGQAKPVIGKDCSNSQQGRIRRVASWVLQTEAGKPAKLISGDGKRTFCLMPQLALNNNHLYWEYCDRGDLNAWTIEVLPAMPKYRTIQMPDILVSDVHSSRYCVVPNIASVADLADPTDLQLSGVNADCKFGSGIPTKYFTKEDQGNGLFRLRYATGNLCLEAAAATPGSKVQLRTCRTAANQQWRNDGAHLRSALSTASNADNVSSPTLLMSVVSAGGPPPSLCLQHDQNMKLSVGACDNNNWQIFSAVEDFRSVVVQEKP